MYYTMFVVRPNGFSDVRRVPKPDNLLGPASEEVEEANEEENNKKEHMHKNTNKQNNDNEHQRKMETLRILAFCKISKAI